MKFVGWNLPVGKKSITIADTRVDIGERCVGYENSISTACNRECA